MARCLGWLCTEKRHERKDPFIDADHDLFIELAALCKGGRISKIIHCKKFGAAFRRGSQHIGSKIFKGSDRVMHEKSICMGDFRLNFEYGLQFSIAQRNRAVV